ncbi:MAG TPA: CDP-diacylglycerol--glycerol-3-phosphate 3-phosphatidyltransferase [Gammaproteobacteria bacterium]
MLTIPNILTFIRIILIPVLFLVYWLPYPWAKPATGLIFAFAAITDWFDGYLARRLNQYSNFGEFLDPVADKLMVASSLILILTTSPTFWMAVPVIIIIGREIVISALREWMAELGKRAAVAVSMLGKIKTTFQMIAIAFLLYQHPIFGLPTHVLGFILLQVAALLTLLSMVLYLKAAWPHMINPPA